MYSYVCLLCVRSSVTFAHNETYALHAFFVDEIV